MWSQSTHKGCGRFVVRLACLPLFVSRFEWSARAKPSFLQSGLNPLKQYSILVQDRGQTMNFWEVKTQQHKFTTLARGCNHTCLCVLANRIFSFYSPVSLSRVFTTWSKKPTLQTRRWKTIIILCIVSSHHMYSHHLRRAILLTDLICWKNIKRHRQPEISGIKLVSHVTDVNHYKLTALAITVCLP